MVPQPPPGQGPVDPVGAFTPPSAPPAMQAQMSMGGAPGAVPPPVAPPPQGPPGAAMPPGAMPPVMNRPAPPAPGMAPQMTMGPGLPAPAGTTGGPPVPPRKRGGFIRGIFAVLGIGLFIGSLLLNLIFVGGSLFGSSTGVQEEVIDKGESRDKIVVIPVHGVIMERQASLMQACLRMADEDSTVKAVVLDVDTPGGSVSASDEVYHYVSLFKQKKKVPVIVSMGGYATSGGYYVSCAADYIYAENTTWTGNIGVLLSRLNFSEASKKLGITDTTLAAPEKGFKHAGSPFEPVKEEENKYLQGLVNQAYGRFKDVVSTGRKQQLKLPISDLANGKVFTAQEAVDAGLVDKIGYLDDACQYAATQAGLKKPRIVRYSRPQSLFAALASESGGDESHLRGTITVGGAKAEVNADTLDSLTQPRLLYLWRGQ